MAENKKDPGVLRAGFTAAGCFLGAGFVSGQELWNFFGAYGAWGWAGLAIALIALSWFIRVMFDLVMDMGEASILKTFVSFDCGWLRTVFFFLQFAFLVSVTMVMLAGSGTQLSQMTGIPGWVGSTIVCVLGIVITMSGLRGIMSIFSVTTPVLGVCTVAFGIYALTHTQTMNALLPQGGAGLPLAAAGSCLSYISYNILGPSSIIVQLGGKLEKKRTAKLSPLLSGLILLPIACGVLISMLLNPEIVGSEIPMSDFAYSIHPAMGTVYGVLLLIGMFGCVISCAVGASSALFERFPWMEKRRNVIIPGMCIVCLAGSRVGFGNLISMLYPLFGKLNLVFLLTLLLHYFATPSHRIF